MLLAMNEAGELEEATPGAIATCPQCSEALRAKCGEIVTWHWAHIAGTDCDPWAEHETDWHLEWKRHCPQTEVVFARNACVHRADGVTQTGVVVEFQHSPISVSDIAEREAFYGRMIWLFDVREPFTRGRLAVWKKNGRKWLEWKHHRSSIDECKKLVYLDTGVSIVRLGNNFAYGKWGATISTREQFSDWLCGNKRPVNIYEAERLHYGEQQRIWEEKLGLPGLYTGLSQALNRLPR